MKDDGGHTDWVSALSCSDELLLSAAWDGVVKLWRTKAGGLSSSYKICKEEAWRRRD